MKPGTAHCVGSGVGVCPWHAQNVVCSQCLTAKIWLDQPAGRWSGSGAGWCSCLQRWDHRKSWLLGTPGSPWQLLERLQQLKVPKGETWWLHISYGWDHGWIGYYRIREHLCVWLHVSVELHACPKDYYRYWGTGPIRKDCHGLAAGVVHIISTYVYRDRCRWYTSHWSCRWYTSHIYPVQVEGRTEEVHWCSLCLCAHSLCLCIHTLFVGWPWLHDRCLPSHTVTCLLQQRENTTKGSWFEKRTGRDPSPIPIMGKTNLA